MAQITFRDESGDMEDFHLFIPNRTTCEDGIGAGILGGDGNALPLTAKHAIIGKEAGGLMSNMVERHLLQA